MKKFASSKDLSVDQGPEFAVWTAGPEDAPPMIFVHPNPLDGMSWMYQLAQLSTRYRCVAVDLPGYGRTPAMPPSWGMRELSDAVWRAADAHIADSRPAVVVGCSIGSHIAEHMYHLRPEMIKALVLSGTGWDPEPKFIERRIREYGAQGLDARPHHAADIFSAAFRSTPLCQWLVAMTCERNEHSDPAAISRLFEIRTQVDPEAFYTGIEAPTLILSGTEDAAHAKAFPLNALIPGSRLRAIPGAGHACYLEQPWLFNSEILDFLELLGD